jgi:hypothetical protein
MSDRLLRAYPAAWRERYGDELASLIEAGSDDGRVPWRVKLDVIRAGLAQRLRSSGPPEARIRDGVLLVLEAWATFVMAGLAFAKSSEHMAANTAYISVQLAAGVGTLAVLAGVALVARPLLDFLRDGGWQIAHRPLLRALASTGLTVVALGGVVAWAHRLTDAQRNGGDRLYGAAYLVFVACGIASIGLWTHAGIVIARRLTLTRATLRRETWLAAIATVTMAAITVAATIWWEGVYGALPPRMVAITLVMLGATALAALGTTRSVRALHA